MDDILTIKSASYVGDYSIVAEFSNGETRLLDFSELVTSGRGMLKMLADKEYFRHFTLDPFTIDWNNEIGFEPEYLYAMSKPLPKYYADNVKHDIQPLFYLIIFLREKNYKFGFISFHSSTAGTMPNSTISSRILQRCS